MGGFEDFLTAFRKVMAAAAREKSERLLCDRYAEEARRAYEAERQTV